MYYLAMTWKQHLFYYISSQWFNFTYFCDVLFGVVLAYLCVVTWRLQRFHAHALAGVFLSVTFVDRVGQAPDMVWFGEAAK